MEKMKKVSFLTHLDLLFSLLIHIVKRLAKIGHQVEIDGYDYNHINFPGIKKAIDDFFGRFNWEINKGNGGFWWVKKRPIKISFIIPAYNCETTVEKSVKSIMSGNFSYGDELIIVNDGSTDRTQKVLVKLHKEYPAIKIINHKNNKGGGAARNTAVSNSKNELIFCLDSDNILDRNSIKKLKDFLIIENTEAVAFEEIRFFKKDVSNVTHSWFFQDDKYDLKSVLSNVKIPSASGNYMYTKRSWKKAGGYPEFAGALDAWGFGFRQAVTGSDIYVLKNTYYYHRYGYNSYWVRESNYGNNSLRALQIITPFLNMLEEKSIKLMVNKKTRNNWFDTINTKPLKLKEDTSFLNKIFKKSI